MEGFVVYCTQRQKYYQGSQRFGDMPKFYRKRNHASNAITSFWGSRDSLKIFRSTLKVEFPEGTEVCLIG